MATSIEEITKGIVELPRHQRLALVRLLLDLNRPGTGEEIDAAWDEEIRARVKAVYESRVADISYEQIKKEMAARFSSIALDLLLAEEGYHRASGNPLLWLPNPI
jgi:putative addiction module component (TIGR02574 family)